MPNSKKTNKKEKIQLWIAIIISLIIVAITVAYYNVIYKKPKETISRIIGEVINKAENNFKDVDETLGYDLYITPKITLQDAEKIPKSTVDVINNSNLSVKIQEDNQNKTVLANIDGKYKVDKLIEAQLYSNLENKETTIFVKDILDNNIILDADNDFYTFFYELLFLQKADKATVNKNLDLIYEQFNEIIDKENCSKEKAKINLNDKEVRLNKYSLKKSSNDFYNSIIQMLSNLNENDEFLSCYENSSNIKTYINEMIAEIDIMKQDNIDIEVNFYTKGFLQKNLVKFEFLVLENDQPIRTYEFTNDNNSKFFIRKTIDNEEKINVTIEIKRNNVISGTIFIEFVKENVGTLSLNIEYEKKYGIEVDKQIENTINTLNNNEISSYFQMLSNIQGTKLFDLLQGLNLLTPIQRIMDISDRMAIYNYYLNANYSAPKATIPNTTSSN